MALTGKPVIKQSILPNSAKYLMASEDRGAEEDADPTDGGQAPDATDQVVPPELQAQIQELMAQYGTDVLQAAIDNCDQGIAGDEGDESAADLPPVEDDGDHEYR